MFSNFEVFYIHQTYLLLWLKSNVTDKELKLHIVLHILLFLIFHRDCVAHWMGTQETLVLLLGLLVTC